MVLENELEIDLEVIKKINELQLEMNENISDKSRSTSVYTCNSPHYESGNILNVSGNNMITQLK